MGSTCGSRLWVFMAVVIDLAQQPVMQVAPLADGFVLVVALLPALQAVLGRAGLLVLERHFLLDGVLRLQPALEGIEYLRNVIGELAARGDPMRS